MRLRTCLLLPLLLRLLGLLPALLPEPLLAQPFPSRQITIVVPFSPGSTSDLLPRALAPLLSQSMGVPVVVENRPGAGGNVGAAYVAKGETSGHTLLSAPTPVLSTNQWLYKDMAFDPQKDLTPVINAAITPNIMAVHTSVPVASLAELIALAKSKPDSLSFASGGSGTSSHLCGELLNSAAGIKLLHVPYKGPAPAMQDVLAGRVPFMCDNFPNAITHVRSGRLRALAVTAATRHPQAPDIPTAAEAGLPGFEIGVWFGFAVAAGVPRPVVHRLNAEIAQALHTPAIAARLETLGLSVVADSPEEFARFVAAESEKSRKLVQLSGARAD
jgi:tripartite-type tricarboxylate transporter receptor subunit TctC